MLTAINKHPSPRKQLLFGVACCRRISRLLTDNRAAQTLALVEQFADGSAGTPDLLAARQVTRDAVEEAFTERYYAEAVAEFCSHPAYSLAAAVEAAVYAVGAVFDQAIGELASPVLDHPWTVGRGPHQHAGTAAYSQAEAFALWAYNPQRKTGRSTTGYKVGQVVGRRAEWWEDEAQCALLRDIFGNPFRPVAFSPAWLTSTVVALAEAVYAERAFDRLPILADALQDAGCEDADVLGHCRGGGPHVRGCWVVDGVLGKG